MLIDPYRFGESDPMWAQVRLLVGANETAGSTPVDLGPLAVPTTSVGTAPVTGADGSSFEGTALVWASTDGYLRFLHSPGYFDTPGASFTFEVWADLSAVNSPGGYTNFRNVFAAAYDGNTSGNVAVMGASGFALTEMTFGAAAGTGFRFSLNTGDAAAQGYTRLTRNHCVVQYNAATGIALYFVNGYKFGDETIGTHSRNPNVVYFGNVGTSSSYTTEGSGEWLRLTEGLRYPEVALNDGLFPGNGDKCFNPPTGPFPTK